MTTFLFSIKLERGETQREDTVGHCQPANKTADGRMMAQH